MKYSWIKWACIFLWMTGGGLVQAQNEDFKRALARSKDQTTSIRCQFEQKVSMAALMDVQKSSGYFYYRSPGLLKWEQTEPSDYILVINGEKSFTEEGGQRKNMPGGGLQLAGFKRFILGTMEGSIFESGHFNSTIESQSDFWQVSMVPQKKTLARRFEKIVLTFAKSDMQLHQLVFYESGGDTRTIQFSGHQINTLTDNTNFQ